MILFLCHFAATVILQSPYPVFEGDALVLRCQKKGKQKFVAAKYIYDGHHVYNSNQDLDLIIPQASLNNSGSYKCHGYEDQHTHIDSTVKIIKIQGKSFISCRFTQQHWGE